MKKLIDGWKKKIPNDAKLDDIFLKNIREVLKICPDEDGLKRVIDSETGNTHLVPIEDIMLNGLKQKDLKKYPVQQDIECQN